MANGPECQKSSEFEVQLAQLPENEVVFNCVDISEKLPWTNAPMENTSHHFWTIMLLVVALVGCVICFLVALGVYFRGSKDGENSDRNTSIFKIIGLVLLFGLGGGKMLRARALKKEMSSPMHSFGPHLPLKHGRPLPRLRHHLRPRLPSSCPLSLRLEIHLGLRFRFRRLYLNFHRRNFILLRNNLEKDWIQQAKDF